VGDSSTRAVWPHTTGAALSMASVTRTLWQFRPSVG
jgi:hypothetical protein